MRMTSQGLFSSDPDATKTWPAYDPKPAGAIATPAGFATLARVVAVPPPNPTDITAPDASGKDQLAIVGLHDRWDLSRRQP